MTIAVLQCGLS